MCAIYPLLLIPQRYEFSSKSQPLQTASSLLESCCWYHKGTNFQANHNLRLQAQTYDTLLLIPQRYEFSSKSQQKETLYNNIKGCCWYHKGTNFQANHNTNASDATAAKLLLIPQRYEFSSKSQRTCSITHRPASCCWYHKGTNFQANHNLSLQHQRPRRVVADTTKVRIFKQITTLIRVVYLIAKLLLIPQRYEFSSKSQP